MDDNEKPKASIIKRPFNGPASYVHSNISINPVTGQIEYEKRYKSFEDEENEKISGLYKRLRKNEEKRLEDVNRIKEEYARKREEKARREEEDKKNTFKYVENLQKKEASSKSSITSKKNSATPTIPQKKVNLFDKLKVASDNKNILLDIINYSLNEREKRLLKDYYGASYDGFNRKTNSKDAKKNTDIIVKRLDKHLKQAIEALSVSKVKYRFFLLSFKCELEYVETDIFDNASKNVLKQAYNKLNDEEVRIAKAYFNEDETLTDEELIKMFLEIASKMKIYVFNPKGIDAYYKAFTKEEQKALRDTVGLLSSPDLALFKKRFGPKFDGNDGKKLTTQEYNRFIGVISPKLQKKYEELLKCKSITDYYLSLIKGFSRLDIEKRCNVVDEVDKKILLDILEKLGENDKEILFTTNQIGEKTKQELNNERSKIITFIKNNIIKLRKFYSSKDEYSKLLGNISLHSSLASLDNRKSNISFISLKKYLEKSSLSILQDAINYGLTEEEKKFLYGQFANDYEKEVSITTKKEKERFNAINLKIDSLVNYLNDLTKEEYEEFILRLKNFSKENDYSGYHTKDLSTAIDLPFDENLKYIIKYGLSEDERLLLQKRFGLTYAGFLATKITSGEKARLNRIKEKIEKMYFILKANPDLEGAEKENLLKMENDIHNSKTRKKGNHEYQIKTLKEYLGFTDEEENKLDIAISIDLAICTITKEELKIVIKRFGPLYDGKNVKELTPQEKNTLNFTIRPKLLKAIEVIKETEEKDLAKELNKLTSKNKFGYRILSLYDAISLSSNDKEILINTINKLFHEKEIILLQKRFGPLYDGVDIEGVTTEENKTINYNYIPKLKYAINKCLGREGKPKARRAYLKKQEKITKNYRIKSLFKYLEIEDSKRNILLDIIDVLSLADKKIFQKRFGPLYDGVGTVEINDREKTRIFVTLIPKIKDMFLTLSKTPKEKYSQTLKTLAYKYRIKRKKNQCTLIRAMSIAEFEKEEQERIKKQALAAAIRVIRVDKVEVVESTMVNEKADIQQEKVEDVADKIEKQKIIFEEINEGEELLENNKKCKEYFSYINELLKILEEEKEILPVSEEILSEEELKNGISEYSKEIKLCSLGFTKIEALFLLLGTNEELNLSIRELSSFFKVDNDGLKQLYSDCTDKIRTIMREELDNYMVLIKEKSDING